MEQVPQEPGSREPYGTGIRNAIAKGDAAELRAHIGTVELSLKELAKADPETLAQLSGKTLSPDVAAQLGRALVKLRKLLDRPREGS